MGQQTDEFQIFYSSENSSKVGWIRFKKNSYVLRVCKKTPQIDLRKWVSK